MGSPLCLCWWKVEHGGQIPLCWCFLTILVNGGLLTWKRTVDVALQLAARGGRGEDKISLHSALAVKGLSHLLIQRTDLVGIDLRAQGYELFVGELVHFAAFSYELLEI